MVSRLLVKWNQMLFDVIIPSAWVTTLRALTRVVHSEEIWRAWPPPSHDVPSGDPAYWSHLTLRMTFVAVRIQSAAIWPQACSNVFKALREVLVSSNENDNLIAALTSAGVLITVPPPHVLEALSFPSLNTLWRRLTPDTAQQELLVSAFDIHKHIYRFPIFTSWIVVPS